MFIPTMVDVLLLFSGAAFIICFILTTSVEAMRNSIIPEYNDNKVRSFICARAEYKIKLLVKLINALTKYRCVV